MVLPVRSQAVSRMEPGLLDKGMLPIFVGASAAQMAMVSYYYSAPLSHRFTTFGTLRIETVQTAVGTNIRFIRINENAIRNLFEYRNVFILYFICRTI